MINAARNSQETEGRGGNPSHRSSVGNNVIGQGSGRNSNTRISIGNMPGNSHNNNGSDARKSNKEGYGYDY